MGELKKLNNSVITKHFIQTLIKVIGRRSSESFVVKTIDVVVKNLIEKYDFLKYIEISEAIYAEYNEPVVIKLEIDEIERNSLRDAVDEIFDDVIKSLKENIGYYFIKEIQSDLEREIGPIFREFGISYHLKQQMYQQVLRDIERIKIQGIKNSEIMEIVLKALISLKNENLDSFSMRNITDSIKKLEKTHDFLKYIHIAEEPDQYGIYKMTISHEIDNVASIERGKIIQTLIQEIAKSSDLKKRGFFIENFKMKLTPRDREKLEKIGVKLDHIDIAIQREGHENLVTKIFEVIIELVEEKTSKKFATDFLYNIIEEIRDEHDVLKYITIDKTRYDGGMEAINIVSEINSVDSRLLSKAVKEILKITQERSKEFTHSFVKDFKKKIGEEYIKEIEKIGVNISILEMSAF